MDARKDDADGLDRVPEQGTEEEEQPVWRCLRCQTPVSSPDSVIAVAGRPPRAHYTNPAGILFEVVTVASTQNLKVEGPPTPAFSWFPGYRWRLALCGGCGEHLGWRYDAVAATTSPSGFWGLLPPRLC